MANGNTIAKAGLLPGAAQGASSTAEFQFKNAAATPVIAEFTVPADKLSKRIFKIRAWGRLTGGTTTNFTAKLYVGTALGAQLFTTGAIACNSTSGFWHVEAEGGVDDTGRVINAVGSGGVAAVMTTVAIATAAAIPSNALVFGCSGTFSASHASNAAYMDGFEMDIL